MNMGIERWIGVAAGLAAGLAILYYQYAPRIQDKLAKDDEPPPAAEAPPTQPPAEPEPRIEHPVPEPPAAAAPAPSTAPQPESAPAKATPPADLAASDETVRASMSEVFGEGLVETFLVPERVIQNVVATVDSLDREPVPLRFRAVSNVSELPVVETGAGGITLSAENAGRYGTLVSALERTDSRKIAALYLRYYPLFQRAYREMGYPKGYFNDRVVQIIDHLLATPEIAGPIELVRPKVLYQFADPELEERSSGQKIMIRIGPENAAVVKTKLREVRAIIATGKTKPQESAGTPSAP